MATTGSPFNLPYPLISDEVNVHGDIQALAEGVADALDGIAFTNNSNTFAAVNTFSVESADPAITITQAGSGSALTTTGKIIAGEFEKSGGLSTEFLKADGSVDSSTYITANQSITISGDATGSGTTSIELTLANSGVTAGTYNNSATQVRPFTVDAKGRVTSIGTAVTIAPAWSNITSTPTSLSGYGITDAQPLDADLTAIAALSGTSGFLKKTAADTWTLDTNSYQPLDADLTAIAGLAGTSGLLKKTAADTWTLDTATYLTGNQTITLSGAISGSGTTTITTTLASHVSTHESAGADPMRGTLSYANITSATAYSSWVYGLNSMNLITASGNITLPTDVQLNVPTGTQIHFMSNASSGTVAFATTNNSAQGDKRTFAGQYAVATAIKTASDTWVVFGNLIA